MSDRGNDACWASCNVLLVLGILADGERAGHEIIKRYSSASVTAPLPGMRATCTPCCTGWRSAATSARASA